MVFSIFENNTNVYWRSSHIPEIILYSLPFWLNIQLVATKIISKVDLFLGISTGSYLLQSSASSHLHYAEVYLWLSLWQKHFLLQMSE